MKRWLYMIAATAATVVLLSATVVAGFIVTQSGVLAQQHVAAATAVPTTVAGLKDIQRVPFYPDATVLDVRTNLGNEIYLAYEVPEHLETVRAFYFNALPEQGWVERKSSTFTRLYTWADPQGKLPWDLFLEVRLSTTLDVSRTRVNIDYGRFPNIEAGLPTYPGARQVTTVRSQKNDDPPFEAFPISVTDVTYVSSVTPQQIADFYNRSMIEYGWTFFDKSGAGKEDTQTGDITSLDGIFFRSTRQGWGSNQSTVVSYRLTITATAQAGGQTAVKLHAEEQEIGGEP